MPVTRVQLGKVFTHRRGFESFEPDPARGARPCRAGGRTGYLLGHEDDLDDGPQPVVYGFQCEVEFRVAQDATVPEEVLRRVDHDHRPAAAARVGEAVEGDLQSCPRRRAGDPAQPGW